MTDFFSKWTRENKICLWIFFLTIFVACLPLFSGNCINGHDIEYHLLRIESLKEGILIGKPFLRVNVLYFGGRGYASSLFYPDFLLYIPAVLRALGVSINLSYHLFIAFCFVAAYGATYFCTRLVTNSNMSASLAAVMLTLAQYHLDDVYTRSAVGEYTAFIFIPFLIYGLYEIITCSLKRPYLMAIGFVGVLLCHTTTTVFAVALYGIAFLFSLKKFMHNPKEILKLMLTAIFVLLITGFYWIPVVEQLASAKFQYSQSVFDLNYEKLLLRDVFKNQNKCMGISLFLLCIPRIFIKRDQDPKLKFADFCLILGVLFTLGSTGMIPWSRLQNQLSFIQFPWRLFIISSCLLSVAAAIILENYIGKYTSDKAAQLSTMVVLVIMFTSAVMAFARNDEGYYSYSNDYYSYIPFTGNVIGGEWLPETVTDRDALLENCDQAVTDQGDLITVSRIQNRLTLKVADNVEYVDVPFIYYKGYQARTEDGQKLKTTGEGENGQCRIYLADQKEIAAQNELLVCVTYDGTTLQKVSTIMSFVLFLVTMVVFLKKMNIISIRKWKRHDDVAASS